MTAEDRAQVLVTARLLRAGASLQWLAGGLTLLAAAAVVHGVGVTASLAAMALGVMALYYGFRVSFDARLFEDVAAGRLSTAELDGALQPLSGRAVNRGWNDRCRGARRLLVTLALLTFSQLASVIWVRWS